jgi:hypothetical protein
MQYSPDPSHPHTPVLIWSMASEDCMRDDNAPFDIRQALDAMSLKTPM